MIFSKNIFAIIALWTPLISRSDRLLELLEVVPADREHVAYKLLVARLYNAGLRVRILAEVFQLDPKTMRAWGHALRSRDPALLQRMVLGPEAGRKRTAVIDGYVRQRWPQLLDEGCRNYREKLQQEIEGLFNTRLSGETLRGLMAQIKTEGTPTPDTTAPAESPDALPAQPPPSPTVAAPDFAATDEGLAALTSSLVVARAEPPTADELVRPTALRETTCPDDAERAEELPSLPAADSTGEDACAGGATASPPPPASSKSTPSFWAPAPGAAILCDHAGLLLFARALGSLPGIVAPPRTAPDAMAGQRPARCRQRGADQVSQLGRSEFAARFGGAFSHSAT